MKPRILSTLASLLAVAAPAVSQTGTFTAGDLYLYSPTITGIGPTAGAIVKIDMASGNSSLFIDTDVTVNSQGAIVWDPFRCRLLFCGTVAGIVSPVHLWAADGSAALQDLGSPSVQFASMAPRGDGLIYMRKLADTVEPLRYLDAANALHTLVDDATGLPYLIDGDGTYPVSGMIWEASQNALFVAAGNTGPCLGGSGNRVNVQKLPLSADGTRVIGPASCAQFDVSTTGEAAVGWSRGPVGKLVLIVDTNGSFAEPRMLLVDPVTLSISAWANNGNGVPSATNGGTWSSVLGKVVILDTGADQLLAYGFGGSGSSGVVVPAVGAPVSAGLSSNEVASLIEIEAGTNSAWPQYGAGLAGTGGIVPLLRGVGCTAAGSAVSIISEQVVGATPGILFVGLAPAALSFKGGSLLVGSVFLQLSVAVGGAPGAAGAGSLAINALLPALPGLAGVSLHMQAGWKDAGAVHGSALSNGLRMILD